MTVPTADTALAVDRGLGFCRVYALPDFEVGMKALSDPESLSKIKLAKPLNT